MQGTMEIDLDILAVTSVDFFDAYGRLMSEWAGIERSLGKWFASMTGMAPQMAAAVYYSARSFVSRADMLDAVLKEKNKGGRESEFVKAALKKSRQYCSFRNSIVHGEPILEVTTDNISCSTQYIIVEGKNAWQKDGRKISRSDITRAYFNFRTLHTAIAEAHVEFLRDTAPAEHQLSRVIALPNSPNTEGIDSAVGVTQSQSDGSELLRERRKADWICAGLGTGANMRFQVVEGPINEVDD